MTKQVPRVSVIVPVKARRDEDVAWLREAMESVVAQTYEDWEMIIINDSSDIPLQPVGDLVKSDDRISAVRSRAPGAPEARNTGLELAKGELLLPLDHDDTLPEDALDTFVKAWDGGGDGYGIVYGDVLAFGTDFQRHMAMPQFNFTTLLRTLIMPVGSLCSTAAAREVGGWDPAFQIGLEEWEFFIRMVINGYHGYHVDAVTYNYRRHAHGRLAHLRANEARHNEAREAIRAKHRDYYNGKEPKMCRSCGGRRPTPFRPKRTVTPTPPPKPAQFVAAVAESGRVLVKYKGRRGAEFGVTGRPSGTKYTIPGGKDSLVLGPDGKPGIDPRDANFFRRYDGGRAFVVEG